MCTITSNEVHFTFLALILYDIIHISSLYVHSLIMAIYNFLSNKHAVLDKKAGFYPIQCCLMDKKQEK